MTWAFRSIGIVGTAFNAAMQPGAPSGAQAGDLLAVFGWHTAGSPAPPDLTSQGFTRLSINSVISYNLIYGKIALGSDAMPSFQMGSGFQACFCAAYSGAPATIAGIASQTAVERATSSTSGVSFIGFAAPPDAGCLILGLGMRNAGSATGLTWGSDSIFTTRATYTPDNRPRGLVLDWIQGVSTSRSLFNVSSSPADSASLNAAGEMVFLKPGGISGSPLINSDFSNDVLLRPRRGPVHEFWQIPLELATFIGPQQPPPSRIDVPAFLLRPRTNVMLGIEQGIPATLVGKDRVLTPVDWQYGWDPPQLIAALQSYGQGFDASDMTQIANVAPYLEFNWTAPPGPRQWHRGYEFSLNLNLLGQDAMPTGSLKNLQWDPPPAPRQPIANRSYEQAGLSLFFTVQVKPPISAEWPLPLRVRQPVQDFLQGTPDTILTYLTTFPPFQPSIDLPPKAPRLGFTRGSEWSMQALLKGKDIIPFGTRYDERQVSIVYNAALYSVNQTSQFLIPTTPPVNTGGLGVRHVGRVILDPSKLGEAAIVPFDFISGLGVNEVLVSASTIAILNSGTDPSPQSIISAPATIGGTIAFQQVTPTILGNIYDLKCTVLTSLGNILVLDGYFAIIPGVP